jgi:hypothetical protein
MGPVLTALASVILHLLTCTGIIGCLDDQQIRQTVVTAS